MAIVGENSPAPLSAADVAAVTGHNSGGNGWGWGGGIGELLIAMIMLFLFPMMFGGGMWGGGLFGGMGGWGNGGMAAAANGALTRADLCAEFNFNGLENAVRSVQQGLCDGFYAMQNSVNGLGMNMMQGFSQAELAGTQRQASLMQQLYQMGYNQQDCCCKTQSAIERANYDAAMRGNETNRLLERGFCDTNYNQQNNTREIIQSTHNDTDRILAKLDEMEMSRKDETIFALRQQLQDARFQASQATQNGAIRAMVDASTAEILHRTGNDCPVNAVVVQPNTPVQFPTNCCGSFNGNWGNFNGNC